MSYRFVKVASFYREFLDDYYNNFREQIDLSYKEQYDHLMKQSVGWADYFSIYLKNKGVEAFEIIQNAVHLQKKWAIENNSKAISKDIVFEQIKYLKPDVVMFQDSLNFNGEWINELRKKVPSIKLIIGWCCSPLPKTLLTQFSSFDFSFVCSPKFHYEFKNCNLKSYQIYHAFEDSLLKKVNEFNNFPETDFIFTGSLFPGAGFHDSRIKILEELLVSNVNISLYANIPRLSNVDMLLRKSSYITAKTLSKLGLSKIVRSIPSLNKGLYIESMPENFNSDLIKIAKKPLFGIDMLNAIKNAKTTFNSHGEAAGDYAANIRLFEVTGVGSCLITDHKNNIGELFEPEKEIVTYRSAEECVEKVKWLLNNPEERKQIAAAGQRKTLTKHTLKQRIELINEIILSELNK